MKVTAVILMLLGIALGVGYILFTTQFSGESLQDYDVIRGSSISLGGMSITKASPTAKVFGPLKLGPEMNPLRANLSVKYKIGIGLGEHYRYQARMVDAEGSSYWEKSGYRRGSSDDDRSGKKSVSTSLATFHVENEKDYFFEVDIEDGSGDVFGARLKIRRNVAKIHFLPPTLGGVLFLIGLVLAIVTQRKSTP